VSRDKVSARLSKVSKKKGAFGDSYAPRYRS
jgi:hypothetical protein